MNRLRFGFLACMILVLPYTAAGQGIVVDHTSLSLFDSIPDQYLQAARNLRVLFMDRSVGVNTHDALNCFTAADYGSSAATCRQDYQLVSGTWQLTLRRSSDLAAGLVHDYIRFTPSPTRYDRTNWKFYLFYDTWDKMASKFITGLHDRAIPAAVHPTIRRYLRR